MSFEIQTDAKSRFVEVVYQGTVSAEEIGRAITQMPLLAPFEEAAFGISDFREATLDVQMEDLKGFVEKKDPRFFANARWALLVRQARDTALALIYQRMEAQVYQVRIFSERETALEWLNASEAKN
jgi:hypothetical protein